MRISDWSSDVCSSDLQQLGRLCLAGVEAEGVVRTRIPRPSLAHLVGAGRLAIDRVDDLAFEDIGETEGARRMTVRGNLAAWREIDDDRLPRLSRNIGDRKGTRQNSSHYCAYSMPTSA